MSQVQRDFDGNELPAYLTKRTSHDDLENVMVASEDLTSREFYCLDCKKRVTRGLSITGEYGHQGCGHSIRHNDDHALSPCTRGEE